MRIISFTKMWPKLQKPVTTTFRYPYWKKGWGVQIFFKNRSPKLRRKLGEGIIIKVERMALENCLDTELRRRVTDKEAMEDGFPGGVAEMVGWIKETYRCNYDPKIDKITILWTMRTQERFEKPLTQKFASNSCEAMFLD